MRGVHFLGSLQYLVFEKGVYDGDFFSVNTHMSHNLNSLKGVHGTTIGAIKGDTRSLDSSSCNLGFLKGKAMQPLARPPRTSRPMSILGPIPSRT